MLNLKNLTLIATEIYSDETKKNLDQYHHLTKGMLVLEFKDVLDQYLLLTEYVLVCHKT